MSAFVTARRCRRARLLVLIAGHHIGVGLGSGAEVEQWGAALYTFRRGKILRVDAFFSADRDTVSDAVRSIAEGGSGAEQDPSAPS